MPYSPLDEPIIATAELCQNTYYTLYTCLSKGAGPRTYLREWSYTKECDGFADLSHVREDIADSLPLETMRKIEAYKPLTPPENAAVKDYVRAYQGWHKAYLWKALHWRNKAYYALVEWYSVWS